MQQMNTRRRACMLLLMCITGHLVPCCGQANISGVINVYASVTIVDTTCQSRLTLSSAAGFRPGDTVLLIQMQGAAIELSNTASFGNVTDYGSAGNYELGTVAAVSGNEITLTNKLLRRYDPAGSVQLVRVPFYGNVNIAGTLTAPPWDGNTGGVLAFIASGTVTFNADMDMSGQGFRGGSASVNGYVGGGFADYFCTMASMRGGQKGEGMHRSSASYEAGRGMLANGGGGGNDHNAGGGGGGSAGAGGRGGNEYDGYGGSANGGLGGISPVYNNTANRIFPGGGGGGGHQNNNAGTAGTAGGGIVIISAAGITGNNRAIRTNGIDNTTTPGTGDDAGGGGGAGGLVLLDVPAYTGPLYIEAKGGAGGDVNWIQSRLGPGGGGGGGGVWISAGTLPGNVTVALNGGRSGVMSNPSNPSYNNPWGSAAGQAGGIITGLQIPRSTVVVHIPDVDLGPDTAICADSLVLQSSYSYSAPSYLWSGGQTTPALKAGQSGAYWLQVTENGCKGSDTINITLNPSLTVDLGNDTGICDRDIPLMLSSPQPPGTQYLWSTGLTTSSINVIRTDTYWLKVTLGDCKGSDTITVKVIPTPSVHIGNDSFICEGRPVNIGDVIPGATYLWNTGSTSSSIEVSESGSYWLTADLEGCKVSDTVQITVTSLPEPDLGPDGDICPEQVIVLDASYAGGSYQWSTGDTTSSLSVDAAGTYSVQVRSAYGCTGGDTVTFSYYPLPVVSLGTDTTVCEETPLELQPFYTNSDSLRWSDGHVGTSLTITAGGQYIVAGINKCGETRDTVLIKQIFCDIWVPNAFTPNGDGVNDLFRVLGNTGRLESFRLRVFNRWGQLLFETSDRTKGWDGRQQGGEALLGAYVYMLEYSLNGKPVIEKGNFMLLR